MTTTTLERPAASSSQSAGHQPSALALLRRSDATAPVASQDSPSSAGGFSREQISALAAPLDRAKVRQREQGRSRVSYLEGWQVIAEANRIFGFDGWQRQTIAVRCVAQAERLIGRDQKPGWGVTYTARVRITVQAGARPPLIREGTGAGHGIDADLGQAHESAIKEAETDAMKRALMTFGNPFGLALYDKQQREVTSSATAAPHTNTRSRPAEAAPGRQPQSPTQQDPDPGLAPLDPGTIQQLLATVRGLPRPALEEFTKAFRKRFQVPEEAASIADRICQRRHHDWIETFLVQHQSQPEAAALHHQS
jgi:DNA recombination protein Rad52